MVEPYTGWEGGRDLYGAEESSLLVWKELWAQASCKDVRDQLSLGRTIDSAQGTAPELTSFPPLQRPSSPVLQAQYQVL